MSCVVALAVLAACGPDRASALYSPPKTFRVDQADQQLTYTTQDATTPQRTLNLRLRTPSGASGPLPVVVAVHGGGFNANGHQALADWGSELAKAGYAAINFGNAPDEGDAHCAALSIPSTECTATLLQTEVAAGGTIPGWLYSRTQDLKAIADQLAAIEQAAGVQLDRDRLAVLAHSAGTHAALSVAGLSLDLSASVRARVWAADARYKAVVANSPQGVGSFGLGEQSWAGVTRPVLVQTGRRDSTEGEAAASRRDPFRHLPGPDAFEHFLDDDDSAHTVFALERHEGVTGNELVVARTAIAFLDAHLLGREAAREWLAGNGLSRATAGVSTLSRK
jgi:predicted dienelactone hydrolase